MQRLSAILLFFGDKESGVVKVVLPWRGQMTYLVVRRVCLGTRDRGKLYRLTIKQTSCKKVFKDFPYTARVLSTDCFKSIASHKKMHTSEYVCKSFLEELAFLLAETFENLLQHVTLLKMLLLDRYSFGHFSILSNFFSPSSKSPWYHSNSCVLLYIKWKMQTFDPIARGNANFASGFQMMSHSHVEKYLNRKEHIKLNLGNKTPH